MDIKIIGVDNKKGQRGLNLSSGINYEQKRTRLGWIWAKFATSRENQPRPVSVDVQTCLVKTSPSQFLLSWHGGCLNHPKPVLSVQVRFISNSMQTPSILRETCRFCFGSFPTRVRPPPLYISEDHGTTQPIKNQSTTSFPLLWTFPTSATRYVGVLGGLTDPRTTLLYPPLMGLLERHSRVLQAKNGRLHRMTDLLVVLAVVTYLHCVLGHVQARAC